MSPRTFLIGVVALAVGVLVWREQDPPAFRSALSAAGVSVPNGVTASTSGRVEDASVAGLHKCRDRSGALTYTNGACAVGSRQEAMGAGSVSVVQGAMPASVKKTGGAPNLMKSLAGPDLGDLKQKRIDQALGE